MYPGQFPDRYGERHGRRQCQGVATGFAEFAERNAGGFGIERKEMRIIRFDSHDVAALVFSEQQGVRQRGVASVDRRAHA